MTAPNWDTVPPRVTDALCTRLRMDAVATGTVTIVRVTQPLITPQSLAALRVVAAGSKVKKTAPGPFLNRAIPLALSPACQWRPIDVFDARKHSDEMVAELSAPITNPFAPTEAGMFARVTLGGEHPSWYWISLVPTSQGDFIPRFVFALPR